MAGSRPDSRSPGLIAWGAAIGLLGVAGIVAGLAIRPLREFGALCIFVAVGGAMMAWRGLHGRPGNSGSSSSDGDGDGGGDGGSDSD